MRLHPARHRNLKADWQRGKKLVLSEHLDLLATQKVWERPFRRDLRAMKCHPKSDPYLTATRGR